MKNKWGGIVILVVLGLVGAGVVLREYGRKPQEPLPVRNAAPEGENRLTGVWEKVIPLTPDQLKESGIELGQAGPGLIEIQLTLPGEVVLNADRVAHIVPKVTGAVREVRKSLGDMVHKDEVMAVLESRELADNKGAYLAARERVALAENIFNREEQLWKKKISAEQEYINAGNILAEARIEWETAEQKLRALGLDDSQILALASVHDKNLTRYELVAPFAGTVVEKHIDLGEVLKDDTPGFKIADLTTVWVNLSIQQQDLPHVRKGQRVHLSTTVDGQEAAGTISYVEPLGWERTRAVHARVVVTNSSGFWRPGLFVTGRVVLEKQVAAVAVPTDALLQLEGKSCLFIQTAEGFRAQLIQKGKADEKTVEVVSGLIKGQVYVRKGAFTLKSELDKPQPD